MGRCSREIAMTGQKYWEIIADNLSAEGWSIGWIAYQAADFDGWKVDAHKDGATHHVFADGINAAFVELETSIKLATAVPR
jgi:hypothetical protein